ncbi:MAG: VWA domain-containing protein [Planctomycetota bacterium]|nr:VWA domain-containing protein [Planctomycetota bacterium]
MRTDTRLPALALLLSIAVFGVSGALRAEALFVPIVNGKVANIHPPVIPPPPDDRVRPIVRPVPVPNALPFRITSSRVDVRIDDTVATTSLEQSFLNLSGRDLEVRVMIPLPAGAAINNSALSMNDQMVEGKLYDAQQAQSIYESIVMQRRDPALLRFAGENLYEARVFPIPPNQERRLKFSYTQMLSPSGGLYDYRHILAGSQLYQGGIEKFNLECVVRSKARLGPVYSPSHQVAVQRPNENTAVIKLSGANLSSDSDFRLYYSPSTEDVALRMVAHRNGDTDDGYFMLIGRVDEQLEKARILSKDIVFVFDTSGSMQGEKIEQAKKALRFCLNSLNENDRFNLITFSTDVQGLSSDKLLDANKANIAKALSAVDQIEATGGTNMDGALRAALGSDFAPGSTRAKMIVFMTDGLPTVGVTDPQAILQEVQAGNQKNKVRIFNFGVGNDVNTHLLDKVAQDADGVSSYVSPREDLEIKVSDFASKIRHPVMTDVTFDFGGAGANSIYPKRMPALYRGGEIAVLGRYKGAGPGEVTLNGSVAGEPRKIAMKVTWPSRDLDNSYLPRVWAMRKIGYLIEDVRLHGQNQEMIREIVDLAQRHGIVTPYTSQLVLEPGMENGGWGRRPMPVAGGRWRGGVEDRDGMSFKGGPPAAQAPMEALRREAEGRKKAQEATSVAAQAAQTETKGDMANALANFEKDLKEAKPANELAMNAPADAPGSAGKDKVALDRAEKQRQFGEALKANRAVSAAFGPSAPAKTGGLGGGGAVGADEVGKAVQEAQAQTIKQVGDRTFYNRGGVWVDSTAKPDAKPVEVKTFSKEYFELLKTDPTLNQVFALGGSILVMVKDALYQINQE